MTDNSASAPSGDDEKDGQFALFGEDVGRPKPYRHQPKPEGVRARVVEILAELRAVKQPPLDDDSYYRMVISGLTRWMRDMPPDEEWTRHEEDLMREMKRLKADKPEKRKPRMTQAEYEALRA